MAHTITVVLDVPTHVTTITNAQVKALALDLARHANQIAQLPAAGRGDVFTVTTATVA